MRTFLIALGMVAVTAAPALAGQCPALVKQVTDAAGNRFDAASHQAKALAAEADALHKAGKHADAEKKAEDAAKAIGVKLTKK